jgi:hypothetical protein
MQQSFFVAAVSLLILTVRDEGRKNRRRAGLATGLALPVAANPAKVPNLGKIGKILQPPGGALRTL